MTKIICPICLSQGECSRQSQFVECKNCGAKGLLVSNREDWHIHADSGELEPVVNRRPKLTATERWFLNTVLMQGKWWVDEKLQVKLGIFPAIFGCDFVLYFDLEIFEDRKTFLLFLEYKERGSFDFSNRELYRLSRHRDTNFSASRFCGVLLRDDGEVSAVFYISPKWFKHFVEQDKVFFRETQQRFMGKIYNSYTLRSELAAEYLMQNAPESYHPSERGEYLRREDVANWFIRKIQTTPSNLEF